MPLLFLLCRFFSYNQNMEKLIYNLTTEEVLGKFSTSKSGLSSEEAKKRLQEYGPNKIEEKQRWRFAKLVFSQFNSAFVWILLVAAGLALIFGEIRDVTIILIIVFINAIIGFFQEWKAERILDQIKILTSDKATVIRNEKKEEVDASEIVPGDIIFVSAGDKIPADGYILESYSLKTNTFVFTGESKSERKGVKVIEENSLSIADIDNMLFMGEAVVTGEATFVVTGTGMQTELGKIANLAQEIKEELTPLQKKMRTLGREVTVLALLIAAVVLVAGSFYKLSWYQNFLFALAVAVAVVPEGLPAALSVALSIGMRKLLKVNVLAKKLIAVETLGSVSVICTDKTGTITKNELMVTKIELGGKIIEVEGEGYNPVGQFLAGGELIDPQKIKNLDLLFKIGALCNDASLVYPIRKKEDSNNNENTRLSNEAKEGDNYKIIGDPTEGALIVAARKYNADEKYFGAGEKKIDENPFSSERMCMSVIYQDSNNDKNIFSYVKGSPDVILGLSQRKLTQEGIVPFSDPEKEEVKKIYDEMSGEALRVLAFAYRPIRSGTSNGINSADDPEKDLIWVGMMAMIDPPRRDVARAIEECQQSGIKIIMITGDYEVTARAIAQKINLLEAQNFGVPQGGTDNFVINGKTLNTLSDKDLINKIKKGACVFARIAPEQKLRIADVLKKSGAVIAMTGDGVNDAPALKKADIGVAMGIIGTDVSKEASDMILLDDNFASIVSGIKEGRTIYQNIRKFVYYVFTSNASEFFTVVIGVLLQIPAPIVAVQILAIDLGTDVFPSLALGVEPAEPHVMEKNNQQTKGQIIGLQGFWRLFYVGLIMATGGVIAFLWSMKRGGWNFGEKIDVNSWLYIKSTSATYAVLSMTQMANLMQARSEKLSVFAIGFFKNKYAIGAIIISVAMLLCLMYVPFLQKYLHMSPIDCKDWLIVLGTTLAVFIFEEARKAENKA
jgi:potassium/sodium efflux P-type ATPase